ncbi:MAG: hypothetical protein ACI9US_003080 [Gammaproteobacteria bacterium]|jgi:hypothetical protein
MNSEATILLQIRHCRLDWQVNSYPEQPVPDSAKGPYPLLITSVLATPVQLATVLVKTTPITHIIIRQTIDVKSTSPRCRQDSSVVVRRIGSMNRLLPSAYPHYPLPTPMSDYRSAHLWPINQPWLGAPGAPDTRQRVQ